MNRDLLGIRNQLLQLNRLPDQAVRVVGNDAVKKASVNVLEHLPVLRSYLPAVLRGADIVVCVDVLHSPTLTLGEGSTVLLLSINASFLACLVVADTAVDTYSFGHGSRVTGGVVVCQVWARPIFPNDYGR